MPNWPRAFKALLARLDTDRPLIIDPPRELLGLLPRTAPCVSLDYAVWRRLDDEGRTPFSIEVPDKVADTVILFQPRAKERLNWWLYRLATCFPNRLLWLAGANVEGGRGIGKQVGELFGTGARAARVGTLGRTSLWRFQLPDHPPPPPDPWREWRYGDLRLHALPGVFGYQGLDEGTALLLNAMKTLELRGRILDFGCGTGIVTAVATGLSPDARPTLADSDALALESAARTLYVNGIAGDLRPCDGWHGLGGTWDWILSNPPFHVGASADLSVVINLIRDAPPRLETGGRLVLVANRHLPLETPLERTFGNLVKLSENTHFKVLSACRQ